MTIKTFAHKKCRTNYNFHFLNYLQIYAFHTEVSWLFLNLSMLKCVRNHLQQSTLVLTYDITVRFQASHMCEHLSGWWLMHVTTRAGGSWTGTYILNVCFHWMEMRSPGAMTCSRPIGSVVTANMSPSASSPPPPLTLIIMPHLPILFPGRRWVANPRGWVSHALGGPTNIARSISRIFPAIFLSCNFHFDEVCAEKLINDFMGWDSILCSFNLGQRVVS